MLNPDLIEAARELREKQKISWDDIASRLGTTRHRLRVVFEPDYIGKKRAYWHEYRKNYQSAGAVRNIIGHSPTVPAECMEERERALAAPMSLTALLMGDPAPGRSALDKRRIRLIVNNAL